MAEKYTLRNYQQEALDFMLSRNQIIADTTTQSAALDYDDMGLGKTLTTLAAIHELKATPCLIVCPKFALMVWQSEIEKWFGEAAIIYTGKPKDREAQWKEFITMGDKFLITNYAMLPELGMRSGIKVKTLRTAINQPGTFHWNAIIWDEAHMGGLFNHKSNTYKIALKFAKNVPTRYVLTGTPYRQGCVDLFGPLSLVDPTKFDSYWKFVNKYCVILETPFGKEIERNPANIKAFREMLHKYMIRRTKEEVLTELPGKMRQPLFVEMNAEQKKVYKQLTEELIAEIPDTGDFIVTPSQMTLRIRQRQLLACPQVLGLKQRGAAIDTIIEHSHTKLDDGKPIIVFTPFRKAIPYLTQAFADEYPNSNIYILQGQMSAQDFGNTWQGFQNDHYSQKILLCVIKSGASFQATAADTEYFLGYEYDFNLDEQAEDRANRMGQKNFVNVYYLMHKGTVDEEVAAKLNEKKDSSDWVVGTENVFLQKMKAMKEGHLCKHRE